MYTQAFSKLLVTQLPPQDRGRYGDYTYIVTNGAMSHTAFNTRKGLLRWMTERGLTFGGRELPESENMFALLPIPETYYAVSHGDRNPDETACTILPMVEDEAWGKLEPVVITAAMSNGRYTLALITEDDGVRTVHTLNPNVKTRIQVDGFPGYTIMRKLMS